jgi:hypothetical protein
LAAALNADPVTATEDTVSGMGYWGIVADRRLVEIDSPDPS